VEGKFCRIIKNDKTFKSMKNRLQIHKTIFKIMKISLYQAILAIVFVTIAQAYDTKAQEVLEQKVSLQFSNLGVESILKKIEKTSDVQFMYNHQIFDQSKPLTLKIENERLEEVLKKVLSPLMIKYEVTGNRIILKKIIKSTLEIPLKNQIINSTENIMQTITGKVTDSEKGEGIPGVSISVKGTKYGTTTDAQGNYSIAVADESATLVFSSVGYAREEQIVGKRTLINVTLKTDIQDLGEVVVVGYGEQKKATLTGAVTTVNTNQILRGSSISVSNSLIGVSPGLIINNRSGRPGNDDAQISIRGTNTFSGYPGASAPLIVIDGIYGRNMNRLNPSDIESVTVLKDASAAIYGVKAANGVILITTKKGKIGKPIIHYDGSFGLQEFTRITNRVNAADYMTYYNEVQQNQGGQPQYLQSDIDKYRAGNDPNYTSTDWTKATFKPLAAQYTHSLSVSGGSKDVQYYFAGQVANQESNFTGGNQSYRMFNIRSNVDVNVTKNVRTYIQLGLRREDQNNPAVADASILHEMVSIYPFIPVYWKNGLPSGGLGYGRNPVLLSSTAPGYNNINNLTINPKVGFDVQLPYITKGLSVSGYAAFDYVLTNTKYFKRPWNAYSYNKLTDTYINQYASTTTSEISQTEELTSNNTLFLKLNYDRQFGNHSVSAFAAYEQYTNAYRNTYAYRKNLLSNSLDQVYTGSDQDQIGTGYETQGGVASYFGRVHYDFKKKYLADVTVRYNGSFNFPSDKRWGVFPAVSLGWVASEENFFKNGVSSWFDYLKIRASWGILGSDAVEPYYYLTKYNLVTNPTSYTYFGPNYTLPPILNRSSEPNPNITWEKQDTKNIGIDMAFLNNALTASVDGFYYLRKDILVQRNASVPLYTGLSLPKENIGQSLNKGVEFQLKYNKSLNKNTRYYVGVNMTYAKNEVVYQDESSNTPDWQRATSRAIGGWMVYKTNGIYRNQAEIDNSPHIAGAKPGDLWLLDYDGDGKITSNDQVRIDQSATPRIVFGLPLGISYKGLSLDAVFSGQTLAKQMILPNSQGSAVVPPDWIFQGRFISETATPNAQYPRAFNSNDPRNNVAADFWLQDATFIRLKTIELSYTFNDKTLSKLGITRARVYVSGYNVFSIDNFKKYGVDPETNNVTGVAYPQTRIFRAGLSFDL